jgi:hypothetical protein
MDSLNINKCPQLMLGCRWYAPSLTRSVNTQLALCEARGEALWWYWSAVGCDGRATCKWNRLTTLLLGDCWECVVLHWGSLGKACCSVKPDEAGEWVGPAGLAEARWSGRVSCSCRWLHCDFQSVPHEHTDCTVGNVRANRSEASSWLWRPLCMLFRPLLSWGEIPYVLLSGMPRTGRMSTH